MSQTVATCRKKISLSLYLGSLLCRYLRDVKRCAFCSSIFHSVISVFLSEQLKNWGFYFLSINSLDYVYNQNTTNNIAFYGQMYFLNEKDSLWTSVHHPPERRSGRSLQFWCVCVIWNSEEFPLQLVWPSSFYSIAKVRPNA